MLLINILLFYGCLCVFANHIKIFKPNVQPFYINNIHYRESINHIFALDFNNNYNVFTEEPDNEFYGDLIYGKNNLKNILIDDKWRKIDYLYLFKPVQGLTYILSSVYDINMPLSTFKLMDNNNILKYYNSYNIADYNTYYLDEGFHNISLWVKSNSQYCLCPSIENGFTINYQLVSWNYNHKKKLINNNNLITNISSDIITLDNENESDAEYNLLDTNTNYNTITYYNII